MVTDSVALKQRIWWMCNTLFHEVYAVVTVFIFWIIFYNLDTSRPFTWHVALSTLAYVPLMGEAIILFSSENVWTLKIDRTTKYWIHGLILFVSAILATAGIYIMVHEEGPSAHHFKSKHGWTGFVSWIFIILSQFLGFAAAKSQALNKFIRPVYLKFAHNLFGMLGYLFGVVSLIYGLKMGFFARLSSKEANLAIIWLVGITAGWSLLDALLSALNQLKIIFKS